ncbi:MAG: hypothetical protein LBD25_01960 [Coriobacteriales bacterium]|jgi:hypothetical protein|nr:hypothetical protein [Coriobacteriales bacterium]
MTSSDTHDEAERCFARLQELVDLIPVYTEKDVELRRARAARELLTLRTAAVAASAEYQRLEHECDEALRLAHDARERGDMQAEGRELGRLRTVSELCALRRAPMERAAAELRVALAPGGLAEAAGVREDDLLLMDERLDELALDDVAFEALLAQIEHYKREYAAVYARCQELLEA